MVVLPAPVEGRHDPGRARLEESTTASAAYGSAVAELDWYRGGEYVITDQAGTPVHPEW